MGIFDRLGDILRSYLNDEDERIFGKSSGKRRYDDPDLDAAFDELNDFLKDGQGREENPWGASEERKFRDGGGRDTGAWESRFYGTHTGSTHRAGSHANGYTGGTSGEKSGIPESLRPDFAELGVPFGAGAETCKGAYKRLLKVHHPDRHAGHAGNMKKATEKTSRINAAFDRIERWRTSGRVD
ncbi:MAG: J domain-containing protein [Spirochaetaceae bacterium]|nr:J domain-containing protein [Spirochaetaceae bacterium]